jgi:hypothetical protein
LKAFCLIRNQPWYRRQAFEEGLRKAGFDVTGEAPKEGKKGDVLVIWNRYGGNHDLASRFESGGGLVLVAENGYIGAGGSCPKFDVHRPQGPNPDHYYTICEGWHNGRGRWPSGGPERFEALGIELKPWRTSGDHILVCPNRSFGVGNQVMPVDWAKTCSERLRRESKRPVRVRVHPGNDAPQRPIKADLEGAWAVVVWSSSVALHSLAAGIPTFIESPYQIVKGAGASGSVDEPVTPDRRPHFERMAWAQWQIREIESGEPFRRLLAATR